MVRRSKPPQRRKPEAASRVARLLLTQRGYGREPELRDDHTEEERGAALSWYSGTCGHEQARRFLMDYLVLLDRKAEAARLAKLPDAWIPRSAAWLSRLVLRGVTLPDDSVRLIEREIASALAKVSVDQKRALTAEQTERREIGKLIGDIEYWIDHHDGTTLTEFLTKRGAKRAHGSAIITYYGPWAIELLEAQLGRDPQLKEAYHYLGKRKLAARAQWFQG